MKFTGARFSLYRTLFTGVTGKAGMEKIDAMHSPEAILRDRYLEASI